MLHPRSRYSPKERLDLVERDIMEITAIVGQSSFLFGDQPSAADMSVAPMLDAIRATPVPSALVNRVANDPVLTDYLDRMTHAIPLP
jgi:glutathione S-transferase